MSTEIRKVTVFGASSRMGLSQVRGLLKSGYSPRAITRHRDIFDDEEFADLDVQAADYDDPTSLDVALRGADAVFFQAPSFGAPLDTQRQCANVRDAALRAGGIRHFVFNTTGWVPHKDQYPCGEPWYDNMRLVEDLVIENGTLPVTVLRPVLLADNLLTLFARPALVEESVYRYCHSADFKAAWICSEDVAALMVETLSHPELIGARFTVGGPENVGTPQLIEILSEAMGREITHEYVEPRTFGELMYEKVGGENFAPHDAFVEHFDSFYGFNLRSACRPMEVDMKPVLERLPVKLMSMREWANRQDWRLETRIKTGSAGG